jgi:hypothetical protein
MHDATPDDVPVSYNADEAGKLLGKSGDWMKKQGRAGRIPFSRVGQSMRWTPDHIREILRAGEQRPRTPAALIPRSPARRRAADAADAAVPALRAKIPPRKRGAGA